MNGTIRTLRGAGSLTAAMTEVCLAQPDRTAITLEGQSLTYAELLHRADGIACGLRQHGVVPGDLVGLFCERTLDMIAAMFGIWKAGAAYLPIDPGYPAARVAQILVSAQPKLLLVDEATQGSASQAGMPIACIRDLLAENGEPAVLAASPADLAYVIFTSGSTGVPKGVAVTHGNVLHMLRETEPWFDFNERDVWTMFHSAAFDFSVFEIWGCLLYGGRLVVVPYRTSRVAEEFCELLHRERVTVLCQTPSAFQMLQAAEKQRPGRLDALRLVVFGGEALNFRSLQPWFARYGEGGPELVNMYGITEITVHATYRRVLAADAATVRESLIGVPIPGSEIYLVDSDLKLADEGEMLIAGPGVAAGYLHQPELTAERFLPNPFGSGRVYRSGDLARRHPDGELVYLGRADRQVKVQGFRIEPGEVEAALLQHPGVRHAHVCAAQHPVAGASLVAYIVSAAQKADASEMAAFAAQHLPPQMRPAHYLHLDTLPLTVNGKIDGNALPSPFAATATGENAEAVPQTVPEQVALAWRTTLQRDAPLPADVNFFEAGGNSLLLLALKAELERLLQRTIPAVWLFQFPTITSLSDKLLTDGPGTAPLPSPLRANKPSPFRPFRQRKELTQ